MTQLHSLGASIVLGALLVTMTLATLAAVRAGSPWVDRLRIGLSLIIGLQALTGVLLLLAGVRPHETLHLLYGAAGCFQHAHSFLPRSRTADADGGRHGLGVD